METCGWHEDDGHWDTDCGHVFELFDGTPLENDMLYCCYCGNRLEEFKEEEQEC